MAGEVYSRVMAGQKFKHVNESIDGGKTVPLKALEVTDSHIVRTMLFKEQHRTSISSITNLSIKKSRMGADEVTIDTNVESITWKIKKGEPLVEAIESAQS